MPYQTFRGTLQDCEDRLNGTLQMGPFSAKTGLPVGGLTLDFTSPSATTVTFTGSGGSIRTIDQIIADFTTQLAAIGAKKRGYDYGQHQQLGQQGYDPKVLIVAQADAGITLAGTGTANAVFGLGGAVSRTLVATTDVVTFGPDATAGHYYLIIGP